MNYIKEINVFYQRQETNPLSANAANLWHALMHVNNRAGWKKRFTVSVSLLCCKASLSNSTFKRARRELQEKGYIRYESQGGNRAAIYEMVSSEEPIEDQNSDNDGNEQSSDGQNNELGKDYNTHLKTGDDNLNHHYEKPSTTPHHLNHNLNHKDDPYIKQNETKQKLTTTAVDCIKFFQNNIGKTSPFLTRKINEWVMLIGEPLVLQAMQRTLERGKENWGYTEAILRDWLDKGFKTVEDTKLEVKKFSRKQRTKIEGDNHSRKSEVIPDWFHERNEKRARSTIETASKAKQREKLAKLIATYS